MFQFSFKDALCGWHYEISFLSKILGNIFLLYGFSTFANFVLSKNESFLNFTRAGKRTHNNFLFAFIFPHCTAELQQIPKKQLVGNENF
jgi:hypothetical protein